MGKVLSLINMLIKKQKHTSGCTDLEEATMYRSLFAVVLFGILYVHDSLAVNVVQCEDESGNDSFRTYCPPDMKQVGKEKIQTKTHPTPSITPTVYIAPKCRACDAVIKYFNKKKIPIEQKNINGNADLQNELKEIVGNLKIPTIVIGKKVLTDYKPDEIKNALLAVGFTEQDLKEEP